MSAFRSNQPSFDEQIRKLTAERNRLWRHLRFALRRPESMKFFMTVAVVLSLASYGSLVLLSNVLGYYNDFKKSRADAAAKVQPIEGGILIDNKDAVMHIDRSKYDRSKYAGMCIGPIGSVLGFIPCEPCKPWEEMIFYYVWTDNTYVQECEDKRPSDERGHPLKYGYSLNQFYPRERTIEMLYGPNKDWPDLPPQCDIGIMDKNLWPAQR